VETSVHPVTRPWQLAGLSDRRIRMPTKARTAEQSQPDVRGRDSRSSLSVRWTGTLGISCALAQCLWASRRVRDLRAVRYPSAGCHFKVRDIDRDVVS
jgi:hypothetical protein